MVSAEASAEADERGSVPRVPRAGRDEESEGRSPRALSSSVSEELLRTPSRVGRPGKSDNISHPREDIRLTPLRSPTEQFPKRRGVAEALLVPLGRGSVSLDPQSFDREPGALEETAETRWSKETHMDDGKSRAWMSGGGSPGTQRMQEQAGQFPLSRNFHGQHPARPQERAYPLEILTRSLEVLEHVIEIDYVKQIRPGEVVIQCSHFDLKLKRVRAIPYGVR